MEEVRSHVKVLQEMLSTYRKPGQAPPDQAALQVGAPFKNKGREGLRMTDILRVCTDFKKASHSQNNKHVPTPSNCLILLLLFRLSPKQPLIRVLPSS